MKLERVSIKWKLFVYLLSFSAILLALIWVLQTVYLDSFYKFIKKNELTSAQKNVIAVIDSDDLQSDIDSIAEKYDICILVTDSEGNEVCSAEYEKRCTIHKLQQSALKEIFDKVNSAGKSVEVNLHNKRENFTFDEAMANKEYKINQLQDMPKDKMESVIKDVVIKKADGEKVQILMDSVITPVDATKHTLRIQLFYISAIMVLLSLLLAFIISKRVSKSIIKVNDSAKEMACGNYDIEFAGKDYKEITELSDTLNLTAQQLARADVLQKELIANVSHDLRTPLTMIGGYAEVMRDIPGENTPENVQVIIDETNRLTRLVNDLLDISKIQAGVTSLETKEYDITESINAIIDRYAKLIEPYDYVIRFDYDEHVIVDADEFKIYQVIYNLISNAVNYTGEDKKIVVKQKISDGRVRIDVMDSGKGIPKEELVNVWERYYKVDKNHKRAVLGTGLGLSIVKNILKLHDANYGVDSEEGKGSDFWFELDVIEERRNNDGGSN